MQGSADGTGRHVRSGPVSNPADGARLGSQGGREAVQGAGRVDQPIALVVPEHQRVERPRPERSFNAPRHHVGRSEDDQGQRESNLDPVRRLVESTVCLIANRPHHGEVVVRQYPVHEARVVQVLFTFLQSCEPIGSRRALHGV